ncbi:MAG: cupin domain-containing protein [Gammaproteobacteria bacterium]|nr:cupin domain-containing protein [Gammaproteobacteria bacterium]MDH3412708.1 cupin domain-containing protein [Gammaproteobacteria bacterium]
MGKTYEFTHDEAHKAEFVSDGLRKYFEYRDLGIEGATKGDFVAHVIRAREGHNATGVWHRHECAFQMIFVLNGWAKFEYDGHGVHVIRPGDCVLQPPHVRHREIEHSADFEVLEIVSPADFATREES